VRPRPPVERDSAAEESGTRLQAAARVARGSGQFALSYTRIREILLRYLSPILVDSVLDKAMRSRSLTPAMLSANALAELTGDIMVGLRLFVAAERLPQLMLELADVLDMDQT
jgi:hypothetical protein